MNTKKQPPKYFYDKKTQSICRIEFVSGYTKSYNGLPVYSYEIQFRVPSKFEDVGLNFYTVSYAQLKEKEYKECVASDRRVLFDRFIKPLKEAKRKELSIARKQHKNLQNKINKLKNEIKVLK